MSLEVARELSRCCKRARTSKSSWTTVVYVTDCGTCAKTLSVPDLHTNEVQHLKDFFQGGNSVLFQVVRVGQVLVQHYKTSQLLLLWDNLLSYFFVCWCYVAKLLYFIFHGWLYQEVLLISFSTWPVRLSYPTVEIWPEEGVSVLTHGFIWCYGHIRRTNMEGLICRGEAEEHPPDTLAWHCPFRASRFHRVHITHDFYNLNLMAILKFLHTPMSGPPQKFFQSKPARDLYGLVSTKHFSFGQVHIKHEQAHALLPDSHVTIGIIR